MMMFNFKNLLLSTLLLATTVPAFAADDCCKDKEAKDHKACCEKMKCCDDKDKCTACHKAQRHETKFTKPDSCARDINTAHA